MESGTFKKEARSSLVKLFCMICTLIFLIFWFMTGLLIANFTVIIMCGILMPVPAIIIFLIFIDHQKIVKKQLIEKQNLTGKTIFEPKRKHEEKTINVGKLLKEKEKNR